MVGSSSHPSPRVGRLLSSPASAMHRSPRPQADALAQIAIGKLRRIGDVRAGRLHAKNRLGDRLKMRAKMDSRFEREDRYLRRLDPDMAEHLLVDRLYAAAGEHRGNPALVVGQQRHRTDAELGAAIHWPRPGKDAVGEPDDPPGSFDRRLAG